jgi:hypothetical protein
MIDPRSALVDADHYYPFDLSSGITIWTASDPQETERLVSDSPPGISAAPKDDNLRHFDVTVAGPESSPYEGESLPPSP